MKIVYSFLFIAVLAVAFFLPAFAQGGLPMSVVNSGFEDGDAGWKLPSNFSIDTTVSHSGNASLKVTNVAPDVYQLCTQDVVLEKDVIYRFSVWVKTQGVKGSGTGATICMECSDKDGEYLGGSYPGGPEGDSDWTLVQGDIGPIPENTARVTLALYLRKNMTGTAWFDDVKIAPFFGEPLVSALIEPVYRGTLTEGSPNQNITVYAQLANKYSGGFKPDQMQLRLDVSQADKVVLSKNFKPSLILNKFTVNASKLPTGEYKLDVNLIDPNGKIAHSEGYNLKKVAADTPKPTVYIDENGRTIKNGKPFFPFGFYFGPGPSRDGNFKPHIDRISSSPFNTIMPYNINSGSLEIIKEYLDYLASKDVSIIYSLKDILQGIAYYNANLLGLGDEIGQVTGLVTAFRSHPAVLAWYLNDEAPIIYRDRLLERHRLVSELDPNHPTWSVLYQYHQLQYYLGTCDVLGTDPYPINHSPVTMVTTYAKATHDASGGKHCFWMVPQVMDPNSYGYKPEQRAPTLDEMIVMSYLCLFEGAKGLIYYSYFDLMTDSLGFDTRWGDVMVMGKEIEQLIPAMLSLNKPIKVNVDCDTEYVKYSTKADDDKNTYLMLANVHPAQSKIATVSIPRGKKIEILRHAERTDVTSEVKNGKLTLSLPGIQAATVIIYK